MGLERIKVLFLQGRNRKIKKWILFRHVCCIQTDVFQSIYKKIRMWKFWNIFYESSVTYTEYSFSIFRKNILWKHSGIKVTIRLHKLIHPLSDLDTSTSYILQLFKLYWFPLCNVHRMASWTCLLFWPILHNLGERSFQKMK